MNSADAAVRADAALAVFEAFGTLLEANFPRLRGVLVNMSSDGLPTFKLTLEGVTETLPRQAAERLAAYGIASESKIEDDVTYFCFTLTEGGDGE